MTTDKNTNKDTDKPKDKKKKSNMSDKSLRIMFRYGLVSLVILAISIALVVKLVDNTVIHAPEWNKKAEIELSRIDTIEPGRGDILACDGSVLATSLTNYTLFVDFRCNARNVKKLVVALDSLCDSLAYYYPTHDRPNKEAWKKFFVDELKKEPQKRRTNALLLRNVSYADYRRVVQFPFFEKYNSRYKHGLVCEARTERIYPYGSMARRSVGRTNETPIPPGSKRKKGEIHGYSGLECALDSLLYGQRGISRKVPMTHNMGDWEDIPAVRGYDITTTIDITMQELLENELHHMIDSIHALWGTALLMEVKTGDIKAICNLELDATTGKYIEAMNRALLPFEPGSVMKALSMIVALEDGFAFPLSRTFPIEPKGVGYRYGGGAPIKDTHSPAYLSVDRFIEYSSNIGMTKLVAPHFAKDPNKFSERLAEMGLFDRFNTGIAGEQIPYFPTLDKDHGWLVDLSRQTYGYTTMIPPLYTCAIYNAIANDGRFVRPRLVKRFTNKNGIDSIVPVTYVRDSILSRKNARILQHMLHEVIYGEGGTAKLLRNSTVEIAGKTGTCYVAHEHTKNSKDTIQGIDKKKGVGGYTNQLRLAFCGFFPYDNPQYTCMVLICVPGRNAPQRTSGTVLMNLAQKMQSRGMLGNRADYKADATSREHAAPSLISVPDADRSAIKSYLGATTTGYLDRPKPTPQGTIPSVIGLGMREAVQRLEKDGYVVTTSGTGFVNGQTPHAGTPAKPGTTVKLTLRQ